MPNPGANFCFSSAVFMQFPKDIQERINKNKAGFMLGAQCMDVLFLYFPEKADRLANMDVRQYINNTCSITGSNDPCFAFLMGMLCSRQLSESLSAFDEKLMGEIDRVFLLKNGSQKPHKEKTENYLPEDDLSVKTAALMTGVDKTELLQSIKKYKTLIKRARHPRLCALLFGGKKDLERLHIPKNPHKGTLPSSVVSMALSKKELAAKEMQKLFTIA